MDQTAAYERLLWPIRHGIGLQPATAAWGTAALDPPVASNYTNHHYRKHWNFSAWLSPFQAYGSSSQLVNTLGISFAVRVLISR